jgi:uncharacterized protein (DUF1330 family)
MLKTVVVAVAGIIAGASIVQGLHAQSKPVAYQVALIDVKDEEAYKKAVPEVRDRITKAGGKYLAIAGLLGTGQVMSPTGDKVGRLVLSEWPNIDAIQNWWKEAGEKDVKTLSQYATLHVYAAEGMSK